MHFDRAVHDVQFARDQLVGFAASQELQDLLLAFGQLGLRAALLQRFGACAPDERSLPADCQA